ncbi:hypothetical protein [Halomicrococcus sp. NG-SE-24]|uniref:hypothetical protein n=1 Tax=Halomicrococcus sp. NG-SE-24 TaxID=3436928 RepID=UPI003D99B4EB
MAGLVQNVIDMVNLFGDVAATNPLSALLLLVGAILVGFSMLVFGYLSVGGVFSAIVPDSPGRAPRQRG